jgi:hypothetical protein
VSPFVVSVTCCLHTVVVAHRPTAYQVAVTSAPLPGGPRSRTRGNAPVHYKFGSASELRRHPVSGFVSKRVGHVDSFIGSGCFGTTSGENLRYRSQRRPEARGLKRHMRSRRSQSTVQSKIPRLRVPASASSGRARARRGGCARAPVNARTGAASEGRGCRRQSFKERTADTVPDLPSAFRRPLASVRQQRALVAPRHAFTGPRAQPSRRARGRPLEADAGTSAVGSSNEWSAAPVFDVIVSFQPRD